MWDTRHKVFEELKSIVTNISFNPFCWTLCEIFGQELQLIRVSLFKKALQTFRVYPTFSAALSNSF